MQITSWRILISLFGFGTLLLIELQIYKEWGKCHSHDRFYQWFVSWKAGADDLNSTKHKKSAPINGEDLLRLFDGVKAFVMFIGHPRSGHTIISSLLDAHPEIMLPVNYNVFRATQEMGGSSKKDIKYELFFNLYSQSQTQALFRGRTPLKTGRYYRYHVPGAWQGTYKNQIKVIGNKLAGALSDMPYSEAIISMDKLNHITRIPLRLIHIVRNPFDNMATIALRATVDRERVRNTGLKINNSKVLDDAFHYYFRRTFNIKGVFKKRRKTMLTLRSHEIIVRPRATLQKLCDHLMVTCYPEFVDASIKILYPSPSITRNTVVWTDEQKKRVVMEMKRYPFLKGYSFESIP